MFHEEKSQKGNGYGPRNNNGAGSSGIPIRIYHGKSGWRWKAAAGNLFYQHLAVICKVGDDVATEKLLVIVIQSIILPAALFKIVMLIITHLQDEDKGIRNKRLMNVFKIVIITELIMVFGEVILRYYN